MKKFIPIYIIALINFSLLMHSDNQFKNLNTDFSTNNNKTQDCHNFSREKALIDIQSKKPEILLHGGIVSVIKITDKGFEKKYKLLFRDLGCVVPDKIECLIAYNKAVFAYLDKTYGKEWRKEIRNDAIGLNDQ
ncbi:MAG: hypothetical protein ABI266_09540 [Ginsengibacter sp.]